MLAETFASGFEGLRVDGTGEGEEGKPEVSVLPVTCFDRLNKKIGTLNPECPGQTVPDWHRRPKTGCPLPSFSGSQA